MTITTCAGGAAAFLIFMLGTYVASAPRLYQPVSTEIWQAAERWCEEKFPNSTVGDFVACTVLRAEKIRGSFPPHSEGVQR
ncbi:MAG: hypothetical protein U1A28_05240 [Patescibacteria group bacterium]|nr:hypothetical protein [Patescibacteria group bacterium]